MKTLISIGLLILLLYHTMGVPILVVCFDESYESASPISSEDEWMVVKLPISLPYTMHWENPEGQEGLIQDKNEFYNITHQQYTNDTLYTILKTNRNAHERFFELAEHIQQLTDAGSASSESPLGSLLKILKKGIALYVFPEPLLISPRLVVGKRALNYLAEQVKGLPTGHLNSLSHPPEV